LCSTVYKANGDKKQLVCGGMQRLKLAYNAAHFGEDFSWLTQIESMAANV